MDLTDLIRNESTNKIKEIISAKGIPIDSGWLDYEALNTAIKCQKKDVAKYLLGKNCRVNKATKKSDHNNTPLHNAVIIGDIDLVYELLKKKALTLAQNKVGNTPLHIAFIDEQNDILDLFLACIQKYEIYPNMKNKHGLSLMHIACTTKNLKVVENFIAAGVDIQDSVSSDSLVWAGYTALHFAASFKSHGTVKILLEAGANPQTKDDMQKTALQILNEEYVNSAIIIDALSKKKDQYNHVNDKLADKHMSHFQMACLRNDPIVVQKFIDKGAEVDAPVISSSKFFPGCTALHFAAMAQQEKNIKILLKHKADIYHTDEKSLTPLHYAMYDEDSQKKSGTVDLLYDNLDLGWATDAEYEDSKGLGCFHVFISRNNLAIVKEFLDVGQNVNWPLHEQHPKFPAYYPIHFAARYQHVKMAKLLMSRGADINKVSRHGTPLHIAFELGNLDLIKLFWNNGADVKLLRPKDKKTMLHLLVESYIDHRKNDNNDKAQILLGYVEKLINKGVDVNALTEILNDDDSDTALHYACGFLYRLPFASPCIKLLLDFGADINLKNTHGETPLPVLSAQYDTYPGDYNNNAADFMMLYHHVQKLKALGCKVKRINEEYCERLVNIKPKWDQNAEEFKEETIKRIEQERLAEIKILKSIKLTQTTSLYDFLLLDPKSVISYANNNVLKKIVGSRKLDRDFSSYGYLIKLQYKKALAGANIEGSQKRSMNSTTPENAPKRQRLD